MSRLLVKGARVVCPASGVDGLLDIRVRAGRIARIGESLAAAADEEVLDAGGLVAAPGFIDLCARLSEPGREDRETIRSGRRAAAAGGYATICAMPDTDPVIDDAAAVGFVRARAAKPGGARVLCVAALTVGLEGKKLAEFGELISAGARALSDAGRPVPDALLMRRALEYARTFDVPILAQGEDASLAAGGVMHEGRVATRLGLSGRPAAAEEIGVAREIALAAATGGRIHLMRITTGKAVELIREAKARGALLTCDATPHHLLLSHRRLADYGAEFKVEPPLRPRSDVRALRRALKDGVIDCVATDHAPRHYDEKEQAFEDAPFGASGLETAFSVLYDGLVLPGVLSIGELIERLAAAPARVLGSARGSLARGAPADLVLLDLERKWTIRARRLLSMGKNTAFDGRKVTGRVVRTIVDGETVWELGEKSSG